MTVHKTLTKFNEIIMEREGQGSACSSCCGQHRSRWTLVFFSDHLLTFITHSLSVPAKVSEQTVPTIRWEKMRALQKKLVIQKSPTAEQKVFFFFFFFANWMTTELRQVEKSVIQEVTAVKGRQRDTVSEIESGRITTPTLQSVSLHAVLRTDGICRGMQTEHRIQTHTLRPHHCSSASETRKSCSPPFHEREDEKNLSMNQPTAHLCPSGSCCIAARSVVFSLSFSFHISALKE